MEPSRLEFQTGKILECRRDSKEGINTLLAFLVCFNCLQSQPPLPCSLLVKLLEKITVLIKECTRLVGYSGTGIYILYQ